MQVIPAVDVLDGHVVRLRRGDFGAVTRFGSDPVAVVAGFSVAGAPLVHVVDLTAARTGAATPGLWEAIGSAGVPFQAAGGIRDAAAAVEALRAGAVRVVAGTAAVRRPEAVAAMARRVGDRLVVALDVRDGSAYGSGWIGSGRDALAVARDAVASGASRLIVTAIGSDGTLAGPDLELTSQIAAAVPVPVIASGGIGTLEHVAAVARLGVEAVVIGRAFYEARFGYEEAVEAALPR